MFSYLRMLGIGSLALLLGCGSRGPTDPHAAALANASALEEAKITVNGDSPGMGRPVLASARVMIEGRFPLRDPSKDPPSVHVRFVHPEKRNGRVVMENSTGVDLIKDGDSARLTCSLEAPPKEGVYRLEVVDGLRHDKIAVTEVKVVPRSEPAN